VQKLRQALQLYSTTNEVGGLINAVQELYQHQAESPSSDTNGKKPLNRISRENLRLICYEYIYS
jgi:hypothetical protein